MADQAALYGVLARIEELGLELLDVRRTPQPTEVMPMTSPADAQGREDIAKYRGNAYTCMCAPVTHAQPSSPDMRLLESLPYWSSMELDADETAPKAARSHLSHALKEWSLLEFSDAAALIASELITNSVLEMGEVQWVAERPSVRLWLFGGPAVVALFIWDAITDPLLPRDAADDDESGRGLAIVGKLSAEWGFYYPAGPGGKVTWAIIDTP
jgi:hypothetical protein